MTRSDHPSQTHLSSSIFCLFWGGGVESVESGSINSSSFSELMKLFGLHPSPLLHIFFWRVANKPLLQPKQHLYHFYIFLDGIFLGVGGGKVGLGGDEVWAYKIRKDSIFPIPTYMSSALFHIFVKGRGF